MNNSRTIRVIPCLDVKAGRVVKGVNFVDLRDAGDPAEMAALYEREGADELVFLDITATTESRDTIFETVRATTSQISIPLTVGGGIRSVEDIRRILRAGASRVGINTAAIQNPELINKGAAEFGSDCIVAAVDAIKVQGADHWEVVTHGGQTKTGLDVIEWALECERRGAGEILLTSMDRDGTLEGYDIGLTKAVSAAVGIPVVASGGAGLLPHFSEAVLEGGADAVLAASLFHFGTFRVDEVKNQLREAGIETWSIESK